LAAHAIAHLLGALKKRTALFLCLITLQSWYNVLESMVWQQRCQQQHGSLGLLQISYLLLNRHCMIFASNAGPGLLLACREPGTKLALMLLLT
jgi:hypothetical protein